MRLPTIDISPARRFSVYGHFRIGYAGKDGIPLSPRQRHTWWDINSFVVQAKKTRISIVFKRHSPFGK